MEKIFVLGAGTMGSGIVQAFAQKGYEVIVRDIKDELVQSGIVRINNGLSKLVSKGKMTEETKEDILSRISGTTDMNLAADCDLVVEAAIENMKIKKEIFAELDKICKPETILASNTSSLSITEVASAEDIDTAMKYGANHPMGPLALGDLIGLDVCLAIMDVLYNETGDTKYRSSSILRKYVRAGWLGRKSGRGFYNYKV